MRIGDIAVFAVLIQPKHADTTMRLDDTVVQRAQLTDHHAGTAVSLLDTAVSPVFIKKKNFLTMRTLHVLSVGGKIKKISISIFNFNFLF